MSCSCCSCCRSRASRACCLSCCWCCRASDRWFWMLCSRAARASRCARTDARTLARRSRRSLGESWLSLSSDEPSDEQTEPSTHESATDDAREIGRGGAVRHTSVSDASDAAELSNTGGGSDGAAADAQWLQVALPSSSSSGSLHWM